MGGDKKQKAKILLLWHIFNSLSLIHMIQDVQNPKRENFFRWTDEKYCPDSPGKAICVADSQRKKNGFDSVLFFS